MKTGIVGLGLIGGSFAKCYHAAGDEVYAFDTDDSVIRFAMADGAVNGELDDQNLSDMDLVLLCAYPDASLQFLETHGAAIGKKPVVADCCGVKRAVVKEATRLANEHGFTYIGTHPMAGTQYSGYKYADATLFQNAPMVLVPQDRDDIVFLARVKELFAPAGFAHFSVTDAASHDQVIAFSSQLAHVVSNAYVKSPTAASHEGFSAGSYRDMTRVAELNADMWTELFFDNRDFLESEIDSIIESLSRYREALKEGDRETMKKLLAEGSARKKEVDG